VDEKSEIAGSPAGPRTEGHTADCDTLPK